jgi:YHS domain-containing protein
MNALFNTDPISKIMLQGYDPVAFHTVGKATKGDPAISSSGTGYRFLFASQENMAAFEADPGKYIPAYGGYCAYGLSLGVLFPTEIETWEIVQGRLLLQFSPEVKQKFRDERANNLKKADENWPKLLQKFAAS